MSPRGGAASARIGSAEGSSSGGAAWLSASGGRGRHEGLGKGGGRSKRGNERERLALEPVVTVERGDKPDHRRDRPQFPPVDCRVGKPQRLGQPRDLKMDIALRRIEAALVKDAVDFTPDRANVHLSHLRDLLHCPARGNRLERDLRQRRPDFAAGF